MAEMTDTEFERLLGRLLPLLNTMVTEAVERATSIQPVTAHSADIISTDDAVANVATADNPSATIPVTRATGASAGDRCVVLFVQGGRAFALGTIPQTPNNSQGSV